MCANLRRASRALTQLYEEALRPLGLRSTQRTILQVLTIAGEVTQGRLGHILALDSTTLTRTLSTMARRGWIKKRRGDDRREWHIAISPQGKALFERTLPLWERAQAQVRKQLGDAQWKQLIALTQTIANIAMQQGDPT
jgi:DNA-binding MarR family transcriptional regulator